MGYLVISVGLNSLWATFLKINFLWGILAAICNLTFFVLGAFNIWLLLRVMQPIPFTEYARSYIYALSINLFAPGQLGDASIALFLKKQGIPLRRSGLAYLIDKIVTVFVLFCIAWYGAHIFLPEINPVWFIVMPFAGLSAIVFAIVIIQKVPSDFKYVLKAKQWTISTLDELKSVRDKWHILILNTFLTIVKWLVMCLSYYCAFRSFGQFIPWPEIGIIPVLSTLVGYIPVSVGGIGTVEYSAVSLFSIMGVAETIVLSTYLFLRSLQYMQTGVMMIFTHRNKN
ncbi:MAG: flippase-like domain-containing protein [Candidatus Aegiribacteria sp.]|nr:flippase-like domain-containing protein [Candidatus Aegiribacteria sp.]